MRFPLRDFTSQYISSSFQDVLQQYTQGTVLYVLDGLGNVVFNIPSASIGNTVITSNVTASMTVASASYAVTQSYTNITIVSGSFASSSYSSSYALTTLSASYSLSSSWATNSNKSNTASYASISTFADSAVYSILTETASLAAESISSSYAKISLTASYALNGGSGGGSLNIQTGSSYPITSSWAQSASWAPGSGASVSASYALTASYVPSIGGLSIPQYDYSNILYTGPQSQIGTCTYKIGGPSGTIVAIVTAIYDGNLFIGVSKSLA